MVFPIRFDEQWEGFPDIPLGPSKVRIQVVYTCKPTPESAEIKAWCGEVVSKEYEVQLWRRGPLAE